MTAVLLGMLAMPLSARTWACTGLLKLADYTGDDRLQSDLTYRWLRAYANYAVLLTEWSEHKRGYVIPIWKGGTLAVHDDGDATRPHYG